MLKTKFQNSSQGI